MSTPNFAKVEYYQRQDDKRWLIKAIDDEGFASHMGSWDSLEQAKEWRKQFLGQIEIECAVEISYTREDVYRDNERSDRYSSRRN